MFRRTVTAEQTVISCTAAYIIEFFRERACDADVQKLVLTSSYGNFSSSAFVRKLTKICVPFNKDDADIIAGCDDPLAIAGALPAEYMGIFGEFGLYANVLKILKEKRGNVHDKKLSIVLGSRDAGVEPFAQHSYTVEFVIERRCND